MKERKMNDGYQIIEIDNNKVSENELLDIYEFSLDRWRESYQMLPKPTFESFSYHFKKKYPNEIDHNYIIKNHDARIIGSACLSLSKPESEEPESIKKIAGIQLRITKFERGKGIGTEALKVILEKTKNSGIEKVSMNATLDCGHKFCLHLGGKVADTSYLNYLGLKNTNWTEIQEINQNTKNKNSEITLETFTKLNQSNTEEYIRQNAKYVKEISKYSDDWEFDEDYYINESRENIRNCIQRGVKGVFTYARDPSQRIIGISVVKCDPLEPQEVYTVITGVDKDFRRRGLCKLMKTELLLYIKKNRPEYSVMTTANNEENTVMRRINEELGFKQLPVWKRYSFDLNKLKEQLNENL